MTKHGDHEFLPAVIEKTVSGSVVPACPFGKIRVIAYKYVCSAAQTVYFKSASTKISGAESNAASGGSSFAGNSEGFAFETAKNEALNIDITGAGTVGGHLVYVIIPTTS